MTTLTLAAVATTMLIIGYLAGRYLPIHRHDWTKWEYIGATKFQGVVSDYPVKVEAKFARVCKKCGLPEIRKEKL